MKPRERIAQMLTERGFAVDAETIAVSRKTADKIAFGRWSAYASWDGDAAYFHVVTGLDTMRDCCRFGIRLSHDVAGQQVNVYAAKPS